MLLVRLDVLQTYRRKRNNLSLRPPWINSLFETTLYNDRTHNYSSPRQSELCLACCLIIWVQNLQYIIRCNSQTRLVLRRAILNTRARIFDTEFEGQKSPRLKMKRKMRILQLKGGCLGKDVDHCPIPWLSFQFSIAWNTAVPLWDRKEFCMNMSAYCEAWVQEDNADNHQKRQTLQRAYLGD